MGNGADGYRRFLDGDNSGIIEIVREYRDGLLLYLNSYVNNLSIAEDCVQDTFIKLVIKKPKFREQSSFKTWLYAIGRNIAIDYFRKKSNSISGSMDEHDDLVSDTDLEREYLKEEQKIILYRTIKKLKADYQQVLILKYFEDFSIREAAKIMDKSKKQVENLLYNSKKTLRSELEKEGFIYDEL